MDDVISRQQAIVTAVNAAINWHKLANPQYSIAYCIGEAMRQLPSAEPYTIHSDGRLWVTVDDIDKVTAVVVDEHKSKFCKQFYEDYEDAQPKRGKWILDRSGAYCCSECMEPCATYVMMKPRDKFCKMCGSRNEVTE